MDTARRRLEDAKTLSGVSLETVGLQGGSQQRKFVPVAREAAIAIHLNGSAVPSRIVQTKDFETVLRFRAGQITAKEARKICVVTSYVCGMLQKIDSPNG